MAITKNSQIDLNGNEMILDADGDTTITADTDDQLDIKVAGSDKVQINATGLGIGQVPTRDLSLHAGDASSVFAHFTNTDTGTTSSDGLLIGLGSSEDLVLNNQESSKNIIIENGGSERMRITSGGTILIGKTALDNTTAGIRLNATGLASYTRNGVLLYLNRNTSDGDIIEFAKDNTSIGRIASRGGEFIAVGSGDTNLEFNFGSDQVNPSSGTASRDNAIDLGSSSARFDDIYATNGTIQTSDQNEKNTITNSDLGLDFINKLSPKSYKFNGKTRTHYGLIAQDVETVLSDISKSTGDFAGFIKGDISEKQDGSSYRYGLRYGEFIAPLIKAIQEQQAQIEALQSEINTLKGE